MFGDEAGPEKGNSLKGKPNALSLETSKMQAKIAPLRDELI